MKISKKQLRQIIKEEAHDCYQDYKAGGLSYEEYQDCLKSFSQDDYGYRPSRRKTSYVGSDANQDKIAAVQAALAIKPNNFLKSILSQLERGRGLSGKQKSIVKKILGKVDPDAASLFEIASRSIAPEEVEQGLADRAKSYHADPALSKDGPGAIKTLLQDDFMDDYGHEMVMGDFADLIDQLSKDPNSLKESKNMRISKRQLRRIIREELLRERRGEESVGLSAQGKNTSGGPQDAYDQGYEAGTRGDNSDMPLDQWGSKFYDAWMEGWDDGLANFHR